MLPVFFFNWSRRETLPPRIAHWCFAAVAADAALLLAIVYGVEHILGHAPCQLCWYQRYVWFAVMVTAAAVASLIGYARGNKGVLTTIGNYAIAGLLLISMGISGYHAGVEHGVFDAQCATPIEIGATPPGSDPYDPEALQSAFESLQAQPLAACALPTFLLLGASLSEWNFIYSTVYLMIWILLLFFIRRKAIYA